MTNENGTTAETIMKEIEKMVNGEVSFIDALVYYAEINDLEVELVGEVVRRSAVLKAKVREDAEKLNLLEQTTRLPI